MECGMVIPPFRQIDIAEITFRTPHRIKIS